MTRHAVLEQVACEFSQPFPCPTCAAKTSTCVVLQFIFPFFLAYLYSSSPFYSNFLKILFIFRQRKGRRKRGREIINVWLPLARPPLGTWPTTQACALTGY